MPKATGENIKPKHWFDKTFKMNFYIYAGWNEKDYGAHILQTFGVHKEKFGDGHTMISPCKQIITIWFKRKTDYGLIAHECLHAVNMVFDKIGHEASFVNDEVQSYYLERLMKEVINAGV